REAPVTAAPRPPPRPGPGHKAWMSQPCCSHDVDVASTPYGLAAGTHHRSRQLLRALEHQGGGRAGQSRMTISRIRAGMSRAARARRLQVLVSGAVRPGVATAVVPPTVVPPAVVPPAVVPLAVEGSESAAGGTASVAAVSAVLSAQTAS